MADAGKFGIFAVCFMLRIQSIDSEKYFIATTSAEKTPCDFDLNKCKDGSCRQTELLNGRNFLCACPPRKTGTLCEEATPDCVICKTKMACTGLDDGTAFCVCTKYDDKHKNYQTPSICYFQKKMDKGKQAKCTAGKHDCTPGQECVYYNDVVCQCPVGNTRGDNCEEDYKRIVPGDRYPCVFTMRGPLCMCKMYGPRNNEYGFCKPQMMVETLAGALNDTGPCSIDNNRCRHGTCVHTDGNSFTCTCANSYTGKFCHLKRPLCDFCETDKRTECLGLPDGTAFCICHGYKEGVHQAPSVCQFRKFDITRQPYCKSGDHSCQRGEHCVEYSFKRPLIEVCQCKAGISRGKNCLEGYSYIEDKDVKSGKYECVNSENRGPVCVCKEYRDKLGFCMLQKYANGKVIDATKTEDGHVRGPCEGDSNRCHEGTCMETEKYRKWEYICACTKGHTGVLCHMEMHLCDLCRKEKIVECVGLPDKTAVCICLMMKNPRKYGLQPQICYTDVAKDNKQSICTQKKHKCDPGQECMNYGRTTVCQCPAGILRGKGCKEEYDTTNAGMKPCVETGPSGPICLCFKYGDKYGFCKPKLKATSGSTKIGKRSLAKGSCKTSENLCKKGICVETKEKDGWTNLCSCPVGTSGNLCHEDMQTCNKCRDETRLDCIGFPDGTALCVCVEFEKENQGEEPGICFYKKFEKHRQSVCLLGKHNCDPGQECVNYALGREEVEITCQCPVGKKRGKFCNEDYAVDTPAGKFSCVDTGEHGSLCVCEKYGRGIDKYGFCKPEPKL